MICREWRFRKSMFGKWVLQRLVPPNPAPYQVWQDATDEDMIEFVSIQKECKKGVSG